MNYLQRTRGALSIITTLLAFGVADANTEFHGKDTVLLEYFKKIGTDSAYLYLTDKFQLTEPPCAKVVRKTEVNKNGFQNGRYKDLTIEGALLGSGSYSNGLRNGVFNAYHSNGTLKSTGRFVDDKPNGVWKHFDETGALVREVIYDEKSLEIKLIATNGKTLIRDGNGKFKGKIYTLVFDQTIYASGRVMNGVMEGKWRIWEITSNGEQKTLSIEYFDQGKFVLGSLSSSANRFQREYHTKSILTFLEPEYYFQIEKGMVISCTDLKYKKPELLYINKSQIESLAQKRVLQKYILNQNVMSAQFYDLIIDAHGVVSSAESKGAEPILPMDDNLKQIILKSKWKAGENIQGILESKITLVIEFTPATISNQQSLNGVPYVVTFRIE
jgi:antitoxin component YwqK of YwqJK toxin-antitoxin module